MPHTLNSEQCAISQFCAPSERKNAKNVRNSFVAFNQRLVVVITSSIGVGDSHTYKQKTHIFTPKAEFLLQLTPNSDGFIELKIRFSTRIREKNLGFYPSAPVFVSRSIAHFIFVLYLCVCVCSSSFV